MVEIRTEQGLVAGVQRDGVHAFLGMPYAAPPVGDLRWRPPAAPSGWDGVRDATRFGNAAVQTADTGLSVGAPPSEDCLYLNVWTTDLQAGADQPVMVWIHGGGFLNGSSSMGMWTGEALCRSGVTVVSMNYRLGAFGFLTHPELGGNFGLQDWVAALRWVQGNISRFGGDPDNVTIFGQSAGGAATRALLHTPSARGLFHRCVIQSAGFEDYAVVGSPSYARSEAASAELLARLGSTDPEEVRHAPAEQVRAASLALSGIFPPPGQVHTPANLTWYPVVDGEVMQEDFAGWPDDVPVLLGCTEDEGRFFVQPTLLYAHPEIRPEDAYTPETLAQMARALGGGRGADIVVELARAGATPYEGIAQVITAGVWHEPALASLQRFAAAGRSVYSYRFARVAPGARASGLLAKHSAEIPYLFGHLVPPQAYDGVDEAVARDVQSAWTAFARSGVPRSADGTEWPMFRSDDPRAAWIGDTTRIEPLVPTPVMRLIAEARTTVAA